MTQSQSPIVLTDSPPFRNQLERLPFDFVVSRRCACVIYVTIYGITIHCFISVSIKAYRKLPYFSEYKRFVCCSTVGTKRWPRSLSHVIIVSTDKNTKKRGLFHSLCVVSQIWFDTIFHSTNQHVVKGQLIESRTRNVRQVWYNHAINTPPLYYHDSIGIH